MDEFLIPSVAGNGGLLFCDRSPETASEFSDPRYRQVLELTERRQFRMLLGIAVSVPFWLLLIHAFGAVLHRRFARLANRIPHAPENPKS